MKINGILGIDSLKKKLNSRKKAHGIAFQAGLYTGALFLQRESQRIVPHDTGDLERSANTRMEGSGLNAVAIVSYGMEYAVYQHENLEWRHKPGRQAKFLEAPARIKAGRIADIVWRTTKKVLLQIKMEGGKI